MARVLKRVGQPKFSFQNSQETSLKLVSGQFAVESICSLLSLTCREQAVAEAICSRSNSSSSPDGISYKLLKSVMRRIIRPLNIIYIIHSIFPSAWKHVVVIPLYKEHGYTSDVSSYRPISLCSSQGKILEKIVNTQLKAYLSYNNLMPDGQHGFTSGKSTLTNLLKFEAFIGDYILAGYSHDIISFDFRKAFEKNTSCQSYTGAH